MKRSDGPLNSFGKDQGVRWVPIINDVDPEDEDGTIPPHGLVRVTGYDADAEAFTVEKPNADNQTDILVNSENSLEPGQTGQACRADPYFIAYDPADGNPANGESWGAGTATWLAKKDNTGFIIQGDTTGGVANAIRPGGGGTGPPGPSGAGVQAHVHVVAGPDYPADPDNPGMGEDVDDWFVREVEDDGAGGWNELTNEYGNTGNGSVYESERRWPRIVDPDDGTVTHQIPLFKDYTSGDYDDDPTTFVGYIVFWRTKSTTTPRLEVDPDTSGWTSVCDPETGEWTITPTGRYVAFTLEVTPPGTPSTGLTFSVATVPPPPPPPP